ncbi:MAG: hypothetical protein AB1668_03530 [Nanoarchaeota archaeon]
MEKMPVFIKVEEYNSVLELMNVVKKKLDEAKSILLRINDLKNEEDHQLELWQNALAEVEKKIDFIDQSLAEPEQY